MSDYIYDKDPLTNRFISIPREFGHLNCAAFIAGIINGILDAAQFVGTYNAQGQGGENGVHVFYIMCLSLFMFVYDVDRMRMYRLILMLVALEQCMSLNWIQQPCKNLQHENKQ